MALPHNESVENEWEALERDAFRAQERSVNIPLAIAGAIATTAPLVVGVAIGNHTLGLICAIGGLNTALVMSPIARGRRITWGSVTALSGTAAVGVATLAHQPAWAAVLATLVWSTAWAALRAVGPEGTLVGFTTTAVMVIIIGLPGSPGEWWTRMVEYAVGSLSALFLMSIPAPTPGDHKLGQIPWSAITGAMRARGIVRRHAIRVGLVAGAATALYRALGLTFGYWIPMTPVAVLQPDPYSSRVRALQRKAGNLVGTAIVAVVAVATRNQSALVVIIFLVSGGLFALKERGYFWLTMLLTPTALLMTSTVRFYGWDIAITRMVNTAIGLVIAVVVIEVVGHFRDEGANS
jgi:hypothetical protein